MVTRRAEIPSLNRVIMRTFKYDGSRDSFGTFIEATLETKERCRRLDISANAQLSYSSGQTLDRPVRRYLVRPAHGSVDYLFDEGKATEETRSLALTWETGQSFVDDGTTWVVRGVGHYDSAGRMIELVVRGS